MEDKVFGTQFEIFAQLCVIAKETEQDVKTAEELTDNTPINI